MDQFGYLLSVLIFATSGFVSLGMAILYTLKSFYGPPFPPSRLLLWGIVNTTVFVVALAVLRLDTDTRQGAVVNLGCGILLLVLYFRRKTNVPV